MYIWECGSAPIRLTVSPVGPVAARMTDQGQRAREKAVPLKQAILSLNAVIEPGRRSSPRGRSEPLKTEP
jgi:hypothetical protein